MCMNKEFVVEEIDPFQTINRFIREIYPEGYAAFPQYGDSSRTKTERFTTVPFMMMNGSMQWKVPIKIATMGEFLTTFEMDSNDTVIVEKVAYAIGDEINCKDLLNVFWGFYRECIRKWEPKGRYREFRYLKHFILSTGVYVSDVFHAIWLKDSYTVSECADIFQITQKHAKMLLEAAGYQKRTCDTHFRRNYARKAAIEECMEKAFSVLKDLPNAAKIKMYIVNRVGSGIAGFGNRISDYGRKMTYQTTPSRVWNEPAYSERKYKKEKIFSISCLTGMIVFSLVVIGLFIKEFQNLLRQGAPGADFGTLYGFYGSIVGSVIAGLVTIFTTYLIINRSYKVDNHQERMSALPHFRLHIVPVEDDRIEMSKRLEQTAQCYILDSGPESIVLAVENVGKDEAFDVVVMGRGLYDGITMRSMHVREKKYLMFEYIPGYEIKIQYEDIYGNRYYQRFETEGNENRIWFNARIPELVLRTYRVRYQQ